MAFMDQLQNGLMGSVANPQTAGLMGLAQGLLAASGPSRIPVSMGQALGMGLGNAQQGVAQGLQMQRQMLGMQALQSMLGGSPQATPYSSMPPVTGPANVPGLSGISSGMGAYGPQSQPSQAAQAAQQSGPMIFGKSPQQLFQQGMMMSVAGIPGGGDMMKIAVQYDPSLAMQMPTDQMKNAVFANNGNMDAARNSVNAVLGKQGAITVRQNGGAILPDGSVFMVPKMPEGTIPTYNADHQVVGTQQVPGANPAIAQASAAQAAGSQGGKLFYTPQPVYNSTTGQSGVALGGNLFGSALSPLTGVPAGSAAGNAPTQAGGIPGFVPTAAPIGTEPATNGLAKEYASQGTELPGIKNSLDGLGKALDLVNAGISTGPGSAEKFNIGGILNTWGVPIGKDETTNYQLAYKYLANANNQAMGAMGMSGSDARMDQFLHGNPDPNRMNATSLASAIQYVRGQQAAVLANYQAKTNFLQKNNYNFTQLPKFNQEWAKAYDPNVMVLQQMSPQDGVKWLQENAPKGMTPDQFRQRIMQHAQQMSQLGAF